MFPVWEWNSCLSLVVSVSGHTSPRVDIIKSRSQLTRQIHQYRYQDYQTPYEKLRSIPDAQKYLKAGITLKMLDKIAERYTDNEMAEKVQLERSRLFDKILAA